jgi:hypothetical protein
MNNRRLYVHLAHFQIHVNVSEYLWKDSCHCYEWHKLFSANLYEKIHTLCHGVFTTLQTIPCANSPLQWTCEEGLSSWSSRRSRHDLVGTTCWKKIVGINCPGDQKPEIHPILQSEALTCLHVHKVLYYYYSRREKWTSGCVQTP